MLKNNVKLISVMLILVMLMSMAACSTQTSSGKAGRRAKASEEPKASGKIDEIKAKGKIVLGTAADYPPYEFHKEIDGKDNIVGFDIEIAKAIAADLGVELEIKDMKFDGLLAALVAEDIDFIVAGMVATEERKQSVDFSISYYEAEQRHEG